VLAPEKPDVLIRDIVKDMYIPGSAHVGRRVQLGRSVDHETLAEGRLYINKDHRSMGGLKFEALGVIMPYLFGLDQAGSGKPLFGDFRGNLHGSALVAVGFQNRRSIVLPLTPK
jgi:hypothetical protein